MPRSQMVRTAEGQARRTMIMRVNLTGLWNVILLFLSKTRRFDARPWRRAAATAETGAPGTPSAGYVVSRFKSPPK